MDIQIILIPNNFEPNHVRANPQILVKTLKKILSEKIIKQVLRDNREQRKLVNFQHSFPLDLVISTTANYFNVSNESIIKGTSNKNRKVHSEGVTL